LEVSDDSLLSVDLSPRNAVEPQVNIAAQQHVPSPRARAPSIGGCSRPPTLPSEFQSEETARLYSNAQSSYVISSIQNQIALQQPQLQLSALPSMPQAPQAPQHHHFVVPPLRLDLIINNNHSHSNNYPLMAPIPTSVSPSALNLPSVPSVPATESVQPVQLNDSNGPLFHCIPLPSAGANPYTFPVPFSLPFQHLQQRTQISPFFIFSLSLSFPLSLPLSPSPSFLSLPPSPY
jgi:hypothetical protein